MWHAERVRDYRKLEVWHRARALTTAIYRLTAGFPQREQFVLGEQMRRAAVSVPSNIAEGAGSGSDAEYARFLGYAARSLNELECQLLIAGDLNLGPTEQLDRLADESARVRSMLGRFHRKLQHPRDR